VILSVERWETLDQAAVFLSLTAEQYAKLKANR
jgi:hypothetical protein